jgi:hypothetical protein
VVVLAAQGRSFCAGFNLDELEAPGAAGQDPQLFEHTVDALEALPVPTIVRLHGSVYGGATDLALACDFRVGVQGMELRMPAARLGLHYYPSGLRRYVSRAWACKPPSACSCWPKPCRPKNCCASATWTRWRRPQNWTRRCRASRRHWRRARRWPCAA